MYRSNKIEEKCIFSPLYILKNASKFQQNVLKLTWILVMFKFKISAGNKWGRCWRVPAQVMDVCLGGS